MPNRLTDLLLCILLTLAVFGALFPDDTADWLRQTRDGIERILPG